MTLTTDVPRSTRRALRLPSADTVNLVIRHGAGRTVVSAVVAASLVAAVVMLILHRRGWQRSPVDLGFMDAPEPVGMRPGDGESPDAASEPDASHG